MNKMQHTNVFNFESYQNFIKATKNNNMNFRKYMTEQLKNIIKRPDLVVNLIIDNYSEDKNNQICDKLFFNQNINNVNIGRMISGDSDERQNLQKIHEKAETLFGLNYEQMVTQVMTTKNNLLHKITRYDLQEVVTEQGFLYLEESEARKDIFNVKFKQIKTIERNNFLPYTMGMLYLKVENFDLSHCKIIYNNFFEAHHCTIYTYVTYHLDNKYNKGAKLDPDNEVFYENGKYYTKTKSNENLPVNTYLMFVVTCFNTNLVSFLLDKVFCSLKNTNTRDTTYKIDHVKNNGKLSYRERCLLEEQLEKKKEISKEEFNPDDSETNSNSKEYTSDTNSD